MKLHLPFRQHRVLYISNPIPIRNLLLLPPMANLHKSKSDYEDRRRRFCCCCKRHPKHRQSPGVCSLCLTEKLSQILSATTSSRKISDSLSSSSSSSSYYSSASSCSSCSSPNQPYDKATASSIFRKSRSMAFAPRLRRGTDSDSGKKSYLGFWSRFLSRPRRKRMELEEALMPSRTTLVGQGNVHG